MLKLIFLILILCIAALTPVAQTPTTTPAPKVETKPPEPAPPPTIANGKYGEFAANTFDFWSASKKESSPLVIYIHGGGLASGDKSSISTGQLNAFLKAGLSVMAINYRLTGEAVFPQHYMDSARAIQYARFHAKELNIDPKLIALTGGSAGGMTSLWIGFHDDLADKKSADPVLRQSTRVKVMAVSAAQTTLVPDVVEKYVGVLGNQYKSYSNGKMFGKTPEEMATPKGVELYKAISPLTYLTKDDPPVWAYYSVANKPLTAGSTTNDAIHHPGFGTVLKEEMDKLKIVCKLRHKDDGQKVNDDMVAFLKKYLK